MNKPPRKPRSSGKDERTITLNGRQIDYVVTRLTHRRSQLLGRLKSLERRPDPIPDTSDIKSEIEMITDVLSLALSRR